jgi:hypothetical protein
MPSVRRFRTMSSTNQLDTVAAAAANARRRFADLDEAIPDLLWSKRANPAEWSVAECIAHLNLTARAMVPLIERALEDARALPPVGTRKYRQGAIGLLLAATMGPVPKFLGFKLGKIKTPPPFVPSSELPRTEIVGEFKEWQSKVASLIDASRGLAIDNAKVESPFKAGVFYDGYSALLIVVRHEHRHLYQAEQVHPRVKS